MSKKKMVAAEFNTVSVNADGKPIESPVAANANSTETEKIIDASLNMREKVKDKLEELEKLEKTVSSLSKENEALKDKLAEYLEELSSLRAAKQEVKEVIKEVPVEKVVEKIVEVGSCDSAKLAAEIKALREENDSYLMKISELTFENARLTASTAELAKKADAPKQRQDPPSQPYANVYRNMAAANGYSSWN